MIRAEGITFSVGDFYLGPIDLRVQRGEYFVLLGPTGCGKSTLLELMGGIRRLKKGKIFIGGRDITEAPPERRNIGFVAQENLLFSHLTVRKNIEFGMKAKRFPRKKIKDNIEKYSQLLHIEHILDRYPLNLSGGEAQRVALARALAIEPQVLFLDEPFASIDRQTKENLKDEMKKLHGNMKFTAIHVTHDIYEASFLADRIAVMGEGKILQAGKPEVILRKPTSEFVARFIGVENIFYGFLKTEENGKRLFVTDKISFSVNTDQEGDIALIRADSISIGDTNDSELNKLEGVIKEKLYLPSGILVKVVAGEEFTLFTTENNNFLNRLEEGRKIQIYFHPSSVHIVNREKKKNENQARK